MAQARYHSSKLVGDPNPKSDDCLADIVQDDSDDALGAPSGAEIFDAIRIMRVPEGGKDEVNIDMICAVDVQNQKYFVKRVVFLWRFPQWSARILSYFGGGKNRIRIWICVGKATYSQLSSVYSLKSWQLSCWFLWN